MEGFRILLGKIPQFPDGRILLQDHFAVPIDEYLQGSPSRMRRFRLISLGITTRPKSSILRTIPAAFYLTALLSWREARREWGIG